MSDPVARRARFRGARFPICAWRSPASRFQSASGALFLGVSVPRKLDNTLGGNPDSLDVYKRQGEGGALTTNDDRIAQFARAARSHGQTARYAHEFVGYNYRMQGFQGAVLRIKLRHLNAWTEKRRTIAREYRRILQNARIDLPVDDPRDECVYHQFVIYVNSRCSVIAKLAEKEIETAVHYPTPVHLQPAYASLGDPAGTYPLAERACDRVLSLPLFPGMSEEQVRDVADSVLEIVGRN